MEKLNCGQVAPFSGEYNVCSKNGRTVGTVHVNKGDKMPPTQSLGDYFVFNENN